MNLLPFAMGVFRGHWKLILGGGLVLALIIQTFRLQATEGALSAEKASRAADRSSYERAQAQATVDAYAAKLKKENEDARKADAADARATAVAADYHAAVLRLASAQRAASEGHLPESTETATGSDRSDRNTVLPVGQLMIPEADAFICAGNQARLEAVREWALNL